MSKKTTELTVRIAAALLFVICVFSFAACGNKGIEGTWVLIEEYEADGKKISSEELEDMGISETYVIENGEVKYTVTTKLAKKPITLKFVLEDLGHNKYNFKLGKGKITFATAEVKGNTMSYYVGEGDKKTKMVFKRQ